MAVLYGAVFGLAIVASHGPAVVVAYVAVAAPLLFLHERRRG